MYIESVPNRNSPPAILLRECFREKRPGQEAYLGQSVGLAHRPGRGLAHSAERGCRRRRRGYPHPPRTAPWPRRRGAGHDPGDRPPRPKPTFPSCSTTSKGARRSSSRATAVRLHESYRRPLSGSKKSRMLSRYNGACQTKPEGNSRRNSLTSSGRTKVLMGAGPFRCARVRTAPSSLRRRGGCRRENRPRRAPP
jgi:hypothetical protein